MVCQRFQKSPLFSTVDPRLSEPRLSEHRLSEPRLSERPIAFTENFQIYFPDADYLEPYLSGFK